MRIAVVLIVCLGSIAGKATSLAADDAPLFPFVVSYDAPQNATNISAWLEKPAGRGGFIRVARGTLVNDRGPIRFFGTNLCFDACFPTHEQADRLAPRLARFGVRMPCGKG